MSFVFFFTSVVVFVFLGGRFDFLRRDPSAIFFYLGGLSFHLIRRISYCLVLVVDDSFLARGMLDFMFYLISSNSSNAEQRVLEVRANLAGHLSMSSLHLAAKSS